MVKRRQSPSALLNKWVSHAIFLNENVANVAGKPTRVERGLFNGYSLPKFSAGEELHFSQRVPHRWDGTTNPHYVFIVAFDQVQVAGNSFRFQLEWACDDIGSVLKATVDETLIDDQLSLAGRLAAYDAYIIDFELDNALLSKGANIQSRLRNIQSSGYPLNEISGEMLVFDWDTRWKIDKVGTDSIMGY